MENLITILIGLGAIYGGIDLFIRTSLEHERKKMPGMHPLAILAMPIILIGIIFLLS